MMHDLQRPLEDLKEIKKLVEDQKPRYLIVDTINSKISEYETDIESVEEYLRNNPPMFSEGSINEDTIKDGVVMGVTGLDNE